MRDYKDFERSTVKSPVFPWLSFAWGAGVIIVCVLAFAYLSYKLENSGDAVATNAVIDEDLPKPPPPESEYEFYNILTKEEPIRIERNDENTLASSPNIYYVKVPGYSSYDSAIDAAKQMISWGVLNQMTIEPYTSGTSATANQILFSIRIGPFKSRSDMNAQRDILYDKEISNEGLGFKK
ncbi:MAG: SPOR domain-containing protein [Gammaproteobacteria bacterium]|nr:SPOR domain-containing protein [Gammaproteobacteria bacterium]